MCYVLSVADVCVSLFLLVVVFPQQPCDDPFGEQSLEKKLQVQVLDVHGNHKHPDGSFSTRVLSYLSYLEFYI